jgi:hypothetical protein
MRTQSQDLAHLSEEMMVLSYLKGKDPMVLKIDETEPNIFPAILSTDVELRAQQQLELVLITLIEGKAVRVRVRLDIKKAQTLADQLNGALGS